MQVWGWLIAYIVGFGLLQLFLYKYFQHRGPAPDSTLDSTPSGLGQAGGNHPESQRSDAAEPGIQCSQCGAHNEVHPMIRYCSDCTQPLS